MAPLDVLCDDERRERTLAVPRLVTRFDAGSRASPFAVAAVDDAAVVGMQPDRVEQALRLDALDERVELVALEQREDVGDGMEAARSSTLLFRACVLHRLRRLESSPATYAIHVLEAAVRSLAELEPGVAAEPNEAGPSVLQPLLEANLRECFRFHAASPSNFVAGRSEK
jgi:hypothetical protein